MSNSTGNTLLALLTGAAIGAGIGILFAPDKGTKTREKLRDGFDDAKNNLKDRFGNVSQNLLGQLSDNKFDLEESYDDLLSNMSYKTEEVISFLETKLADLKEKNAKLQK
jgi:gas vesicle protein